MDYRGNYSICPTSSTVRLMRGIACICHEIKDGISYGRLVVFAASLLLRCRLHLNAFVDVKSNSYLFLPTIAIGE